MDRLNEIRRLLRNRGLSNSDIDRLLRSNIVYESRLPQQEMSSANVNSGPYSHSNNDGWLYDNSELDSDYDLYDEGEDNDEDEDYSEDEKFGKKNKRRSYSLKEQAKRLKIRLTVTRNGKRVSKHDKVLRKQIKNKLKSK
tara:strand:- start:251 stop:670 length:420 start_codon:yes stop_codon:yes gene_type:complete